DNRGRLTTHWNYQAGGSLESEAIFSYNSRGNLIERVNFTSEGTMRDRYRFAYDEKGDLTEESEYGPDERLKHRTVYDYRFDSRGNWTKQTKFEADITDRGFRTPIDVADRKIVYFGATAQDPRPPSSVSSFLHTGKPLTRK